MPPSDSAGDQPGCAGRLHRLQVIEQCGLYRQSAAADRSSASRRRPEVSAVRDMKNWKNPYLIVRVDGVGLLDSADNEQKLLTPDQLLAALAELPTSAWPYGRVVAVAESAPAGSSEADKAQLRRNRALVAGTLENLQVVINWVPSV